MKHNEEHYRGTTKKSRFAFGFGSFGTGLIYTMITAYLMFFLTQVAGLSGSIVGTFFLLAKFFDAVDDPLVGALVNNGKSRGVKYRTWIIFGAIISAILFAFMFLPVSFSLTGKYFYYFTLYILWSIAYTVVDIPYTSLVPNAAGSEDERYKMNSSAQIFSGVATIGVTVLVPIVISEISKNSTGHSEYFIISVLIALLSIISLFVAGFGVKERKNSKVAEAI
ncbi:MAG: MFS transporter, partial [Clostridia bacterium]